MTATPQSIVHLLPTGVEGPVTLGDGTAVLVRAALPRDEELLEVFASGLSGDALRLRFFRPARPELVPGEALTPGAVGDRLSLLVFRREGPDLHIVAHGEYVRTTQDPHSAEVAFLVADTFRHRGVATLLLRRLARAARMFGIHQFEAEVLPENSEMIDLFRSSGFRVHLEWTGQSCHVAFPILSDPTPRALPAPAVEVYRRQRSGIRA
jgi:GNAT superfamily N-acetyltransferase